jgi:hypothetical protein
METKTRKTRAEMAQSYPCLRATTDGSRLDPCYLLGQVFKVASAPSGRLG